VGDGMNQAWAQLTGDAGAAGGGPPMVLQLLPFVAVLFIMYLLFIRPEQRRQKEHQQLLDQVKRNDQVVLSCGMHGRVVGMAEKTVTIEIAPKVQATFDRTAIQTVQALALAEAKDKEREKS
jgi:preprotein translocase subunit YajC